MKVTLDRETLLTTLSRIQGVVDKKHSMAVLTNALLEAEDNQLKVTATDLEVTLQQFCEAKVGSGGRAAVSARTLFDIVRESDDEEIALSVFDNQWLGVAYGKSNFKLMGIDPDEYPSIADQSGNGKAGTTVKIEAGELAEMIRKTVFSVSSDDTRSNLAGVYLGPSDTDEMLRMVATDGHRLALVDRKSNGTLPSQGVILPKKGLSEAVKMLSEAPGQVELSISETEASLSVSGALLSMRLVEGNFPDYNRVIPDAPTKLVEIERDKLLHTLRRVSILSNERARGVRFALSSGALEVTANNPDMGEASEEIDVSYKGDGLQVGFNANYLIDVLGVVPEGSKITLGLGDELSPGLVSSDDKGYQYVVMPLRI